MALITCKECNKEFSDTLNACPHCGYQQEAAPVSNTANTKTPKMDPFCLAGGIVGLCSFFIDFFGLVAITGIILSAVGISRIKVSGDKGRGWAITGLIIGIIEAAYKFFQLVAFLSI